MAILTITTESGSTIALPDPSEMSVAVQDIDAGTTTRNAKGEMLRDRVCGGATAKRKIEISWSGLKIGTVSQILQAIGDVFFKVTYPDTYTGEFRTATFYVGDRTSKVYKMVDGLVDNCWMESLKANFIEK